MCERQARKKNVDLFNKFWTNIEWKRIFLLQKRFADGLLKVYSIKAIIKALQTKVGSNIYSLSAKWLDNLIQIEEKRLETQSKQVPTTPKEDSIDNSKLNDRPTFIPKKSLTDLLD